MSEFATNTVVDISFQVSLLSGLYFIRVMTSDSEIFSFVSELFEPTKL